MYNFGNFEIFFNEKRTDTVQFQILNLENYKATIRVNVPIVVQFVVVPMCFNGFKVTGRTISEYFNTYVLEYVLSSQSQPFLP